MVSALWSALAVIVLWPYRVALALVRMAVLGRTGVVSITVGRTGARTVTSTVHELQGLRMLAADPGVRAVRLHILRAPKGHATLQQLARAIRQVRAAGKLVVAHLDTAGLKELYLASVTDRSWLTPSGELLLTSLGNELVYFGDLLDRFGVMADLEAAGAYKSFGESLRRAWPTPENREQLRELCADLQDQCLAGIARGRGIERQSLDALLASSPLSATRAVQAGLVDGLAYPDQVDRALKELLGGSPRRISFDRYVRYRRLERRLARIGRQSPAVALVQLEGPVVETFERSPTRGHCIDMERVVPALDSLAASDEVRAVVLYVESPGGSALASDRIARAVQRLGQKKPVVAFFGDVAASGGYYLAAPATRVVATPGAITGSIGVVGGKLVLGPALERFGIHGELVAAGPDADLLSPWRPFAPDQRARFRASLDRVYDRFLRVVASGRRRPVEEVARVAEGRVWTGRQGQRNGLVDELGDLEVAVERACLLASIDPRTAEWVEVRFPPPRLRRFTALLRTDGGPGLPLAPQLVPSSARLLAGWLRASPGVPLALLPWISPRD